MFGTREDFFSFRHGRESSPTCAVLTMPNLQGYRFAVKPLKPVKPNPKDPEWKFLYASRERIDALRQYFAHFATRLEGWHQNPRTHALHPKDRHPEIPWYQVQERYRPQVEAWFQKKLAECKAQGRPLTAGKIQSLRMNAANFGRYVLTGKRRGNQSYYARNKRIWFAYLEWSAEQDRRGIEIAKDFTPSKRLEL
jgi:hypothetical protein